MALDPSIALQVQPLKVQGPLDLMAQAAPVIGLRQALAEEQRKQQARSELAALGPEPSQQKLAVWAARHSGPEAVMKAQQASLDRQATRDVTYDTSMARIDQQRDAATQRHQQEVRYADMMHEWRMMNARTTQEQAAERARHNKVVEGLTAGANETRAELARLRATTAAQGKALPAPLQKQLTEAAELDDATQRFHSTFKPEYGGKTVTGELGNVYGKVMGDSTGQTQWWQDYELHQSQVRNKLFGSALTAPEIEAWNKSAINPRMDPKQIKLNLERRATLERTAINRLMKGAAAGGYNKDQIEAFTGRPVPNSAPTGENDPLGIR